MKIQPKTFKKNWPLFFVILLFVFAPSPAIFGQSYGQEFDIAVSNYNHFYNQKDFNKAQKQARMAYDFALKSNKTREAQAFALILEAKAYMKMTKRASKNRKRARERLEESLVLLADSGNKGLKKENYTLLKTIAIKEDDDASAVIYADKIKDMEMLSAKKLQEEQMAQQNKALASNQKNLESKLQSLNKDVTSLATAKVRSDSMFTQQKIVTDSLITKVAWDSILLVQQQNALIQQKSELQLQKSQRNFSYALAGIVTLLLIGLFLRYFETSKHNAALQAKNEVIEAERERSESLLLNILPSLVANELKSSGIAKARSYNNASVLFTDFVKFSALAQTLKPEELVGVLDFYFTSFDKIISKYNVEKIKTIGDSYMVASGLPKEYPENPLEIVKAGLEIQSFICESKKQRQENNLPYFDARVGIHTGPLVAGVVGHKKFAYDIWGDTVNVAARLESNCEAGRVNVSATTYEYIKNHYECEFRGMIPVKNRGEVGMYYIQA